jgi:hypothetical protein
MPVFLCGHGTWHLADGFTRVPAGTQITFYTHNAKTLHLPEALKVLDGTTEFTDGQKDVYKAGMGVPNMTLSALTLEQRMRFEQAATQRTDSFVLIFADPDNPKRLSEIMTPSGMGEGNKLIWLACRKVKLEEVKGRVDGQLMYAGARIGVNVRDSPATFYSAKFPSASSRSAPTDQEKKEFRGFMPAGWSLPRAAKKTSG